MFFKIVLNIVFQNTYNIVFMLFKNLGFENIENIKNCNQTSFQCFVVFQNKKLFLKIIGCSSKVSQCIISIRNKKTYEYISMDNIELV